MSRARIHSMQSRSATQAPVIAAVRVPPSAWMHVAIDHDLALAERRRGRPRRGASGRSGAGSRACGPTACPAEASRRVRSCGGARQHAVFGRHPALAAAAQPGRHLLVEARGAEHMGVAEADQAGALGMLGDAALEADRRACRRRRVSTVACGGLGDARPCRFLAAAAAG